MHIEFEKAVHAAALAWVREAELSPETRDVLRELLATSTTVSRAPKNVNAELASSVAFALASKLESQGIRKTPHEIAVELLKRIPEEARSSFRFEESSGFLNALVAAGFYERFIRSLEESEGNVLFSRSSFSPLEAPVSATHVPVALPPVDLEAAVRRAGRDSDARSFYEQRQPITEFDDALMLLALVADSELEARPYLAGLLGSENVPWFVRRFLRDSRAFERSLAVRADKAGLTAHELGTPFTKALLQSLASFRGHLLAASELNRPELVVSWMLKTIRIFYRFYNTPEVRQLGKAGCDESPRNTLSLASRFSRSTVESLIAMLRA